MVYKDGVALAGLGLAHEEPVLFTQRRRPDGIFHEVLIDLHATIVEVDAKLRPQVQCVVPTRKSISKYNTFMPLVGWREFAVPKRTLLLVPGTYFWAGILLLRGLRRFCRQLANVVNLIPACFANFGPLRPLWSNCARNATRFFRFILTCLRESILSVSPVVDVIESQCYEIYYRLNQWC
jgi:hypothetical protein